MPRFVWPIVALALCLIPLSTMAQDHSKTPTIDLSTPLKTYNTYLEGRLADHLPTIMACLTADAPKKAVVEVMVKYDIARHKLEKAALAKFGAEASKVILDNQRPIQNELLAQKERLIASKPDIDRDGAAAVLYLQEERNLPPGIEPFNEAIHFVHVGNQWKIDGVKLLHQEDPDDPEQAQQQHAAATLYKSIGEFMDALTAGIKKGTYGSAAQVRAALDKQWDTLATPGPGDAAPAKPPGEEPTPKE